MLHPTTHMLLMLNSVSQVSVTHKLLLRPVVASIPTTAAVDTQTNVSPVTTTLKALRLPINLSHKALLGGGLGMRGSSESGSEIPSPSRTVAATDITTTGSIERGLIPSSRNSHHTQAQAHLANVNSTNISNGPWHLPSHPVVLCTLQCLNHLLSLNCLVRVAAWRICHTVISKRSHPRRTRTIGLRIRRIRSGILRPHRR